MTFERFICLRGVVVMKLVAVVMVTRDAEIYVGEDILSKTQTYTLTGETSYELSL